MIVWLASYPRSGNSLFANLVKHHLGIPLYSVYNESDIDIYNYLDNEHLQTAAKSSEIFIVKTHEMPNDNFPAIYLVRDGRDVVISYAHYIIDKKINIPTTPQNNLLEWALDALLISTDQFGGWGAHVSAWTERATKPVIICYEDLIQHHKQLEILEFTLYSLGITSLPVINKFRLPDFSYYHNENAFFYRKGKTGSWITEMSLEYHLKFWEQYGNVMQKIGYKKEEDQNIMRTEFIMSEITQNLEKKMKVFQQSHQQLTKELIETNEHLKQTQMQLEILEKNKYRELIAKNDIISFLSKQLELKTEQISIQETKWKERTALLISEMEEQQKQFIAKNDAISSLSQQLELKTEQTALLISKMEEQQKQFIAKNDAVSSLSQQLELKIEQISVQKTKWQEQTALLISEMEEQQRQFIVKDQELIAKEQVIQNFRNSLSYTFLHGPFRHLPIISKTKYIVEQWLVLLKDKWHYYLAPRLGVLHQFPPKPCDLPASYFKVKRLIQPVPILSIVTPTYNYAHFLERTMKSVVFQGYPKLEYIVQDGGSSDNTIEIAEKYRHYLKYFESKKDNGQSHAINLGFQHATGEIMAYLNSDDVLLPGTLNYIANYFSGHPKVDVVYGHRLIINNDDLVVGEWVMPPHDGKVLRWADYIPQETLFWRRRIWEKVGGQIDESFQFAMDWDLLLRFEEANAVIVRLPRFLAAFRVHTQQKTSAQILYLGEKEVAALRRRNFRREVQLEELKRNINPFLRRSLLYHWLYKLEIKIHKFLVHFIAKKEL